MRYKKKPKPIPKPVILFDDRERKPWLFLSPEFKLVRTRLDVGDYTLEGYERDIAIEKKSGLLELFSNLDGSNRSRFDRFLYSLSQVPTRAILVEDDLSNLDKAFSALKKKSGGKTRLTLDTIPYWIARITLEYRIPVVFLGRNIATREQQVRHFFRRLTQCTF